MSASPMTLVLRLPPSANALWLMRGRKRVMAPAYREWRALAGAQLEAQMPTQARARPMIQAPLGVDIGLPLKLRGDIDNRIKPLLDLLVTHDVMDDDRHVAQLFVARRVVDPGTAIVTVRTVIPR